jgi:hypothetical protein
LIQANKELATIVSMRNDLDVVKAELGVLINDVFTFYKESIGSSEGMSLRDIVIQKGYMLTHADLKIFKAKCLSGSYNLKFRLTPPVFVEWLEEYIFERGENYANENLKAKKIKESELPSENELKLIKLFAETKTIPKEIEPSEEDEYNKRLRIEFNAIFSDFKQLLSVQGRDTSNGKQFVNLEGKEMDINEYLKFRLKK